jgi:hypothetical protein
MGYKDIDIISLYVVDTREITSVSIAGCNNVDTKGDNTSGSSNYLAYDNMGNNVTSSGT